jgi:hypothetical protein
VLWWPNNIGSGSMALKYASGRELDWPIIAFAPRKTALTLFLTCDIKHYHHLLDKLGMHKTGVGCLYIERHSDVDAKVREKMVKVAVNDA